MSPSLYKLHVELDLEAHMQCPQGYSSSLNRTSGTRYCLRVVPTAGTRDELQAACAPYPLAIVDSAEDIVVINDALPDELNNTTPDVWCVARHRAEVGTSFLCRRLCVAHVRFTRPRLPFLTASAFRRVLNDRTGKQAPFVSADLWLPDSPSGASDTCAYISHEGRCWSTWIVCGLPARHRRCMLAAAGAQRFE